MLKSIEFSLGQVFAGSYREQRTHASPSRTLHCPWWSFSPHRDICRVFSVLRQPTLMVIHGRT